MATAAHLTDEVGDRPGTLAPPHAEATDALGAEDLDHVDRALRRDLGLRIERQPPVAWSLIIGSVPSAWSTRPVPGQTRCLTPVNRG